MKKKILFVIGISTMIVYFSTAQVDNSLRYRQDNFGRKERIKQGWKDGELNHREIRQIRNQEKRIRRTERIMLCDGKITKNERRHLKRMKREANRNVYRQKHDRQKRRCR